jgi:hypothetical protein
MELLVLRDREGAKPPAAMPSSPADNVEDDPPASKEFPESNPFDKRSEESNNEVRGRFFGWN